MDNTKGLLFKKTGSTPSVKKGKNYFLGIGINAYTVWSALYNAVRDVENIQSILFERYNFDAAQILINADATRERIEEVLYAFTPPSVLEENDSLLIYYSGHGHLDTNKRGFWVPVDAEKGKIAKYLPNSRIKEIIADIKCRHVLLISDSCFSGSFFTRGRGDTRDNAAMEEHEKRISRWAFCSGRHNEVVSDGPPNGNSPFASAIIQELRINTAEKLNFVRLADKVTEITRANYPQMPDANPIQNAGHGGGQFVFSLKNNEAEEWRLLDKTSVSALEGFGKKYPLSIFGVEADKLIKNLNHEATWQRAKEWHNETSYLTYLRAYPNGIYAEQAKIAMREIADEVRWQKVKRENSVVAFWEYIEAFPNGKYVKEAEEGLDAFEQKYIKEQEKKQQDAELERKRKSEVKRKEKEVEAKIQQELEEEDKLWQESQTKQTPSVYLDKYPNGLYVKAAIVLKEKLEEEEAEEVFWKSCQTYGTPLLFFEKYSNGRFVQLSKAEVIVMPRLSDSMEEGEIVIWHKNIGDKVEKGDLLAEINSDKATMDFESPKTGILFLVAKVGEKIPIGKPIVVIIDGSKKFEHLSAYSFSAQSSSNEIKTAASLATMLQIPNSNRIFHSPLAKEMAKVAGIAIESLDEQLKEKLEDKDAEEAFWKSCQTYGTVIVMPRLSDSMEEGEIVIWHKNSGDKVKRGDLLAEINSDKATMDFESPKTGILFFVAKVGEKIPIGKPIVVIVDRSEKI